MRKASIVGSLASVGLLTALLAGCGSSSTAASSSGPQTVNLITWVNPPAVTVLKQIDQEFHKKYPNITVNYQTAANTAAGYQTMQQTSVKSASTNVMGILPFEPLPKDPTVADESDTQLWATHGEFLALNGQPWLKNFNSSDLSTTSYDGKVYGLISGVYQYGVFYNKAIFAKYHLSVPTTFNEFIHVDQVLKSHGVTPLFDGLQNAGPVYLQFIYIPLMQDVWGSTVANHDLNTALWNGTTKWTNPKFIEVLNRTKDVMQYLEPNFTGVPWESMPGDFADGKSAMLLDGSWDLASVQKANPSLQVGYFPFPGSNNAANNQSTTQGDLTFAVLARAKDQSAALKWLSFFATPKIYAQYVDATGISPSMTTGTYDDYSSKVLGSWFGKGELISSDFPSLPTSGPYYDEGTNWPTLILDMYQNKYSSEQVAQMYQKDWPQVISK